MVYRWLLRRQIRAGFEGLSPRDIDTLPLADNIHFTYLGDHALAIEAHSADEVRAWLREQLFGRIPGLRFEVQDLLVDGPPWATRAAIRYRALDGDKLVYRGVSFVRMSWARIVEERVLPDTQAVAAFAPAPR
jgi:ketosteroid isomerase-like protein